MEFLEKLEAFKQRGIYGTTVYYGEGIGCDDNDVEPQKRSLRIVGAPVGFLGEVRVLYTGTVEHFHSFDIKTEPTQVTNPPVDEDIKEPGLYYWGTDSSLEEISKRGRLFVMEL
jgi:hypothetical protein